MQSNILADTCEVQNDFNEALKDMTGDLTNNGWILPQLESNMRNQINISNVIVEGGNGGFYPMQSYIPKLETMTNIVGELPIMLKIKDDDDWSKKKDQILEHSFQVMNNKDQKNVVVLYNDEILFKDVGKDLKRLLKDKTVVDYPSSQGKQKTISNVKDFIELDDHILFTNYKYFNGCEASKIIFLNRSNYGQRNTLMRGVTNVMCVNVGSSTKISGMKEDERFL